MDRNPSAKAANRDRRTAEILSQLDELADSVRADLHTLFKAHNVSPATGWRRIKAGKFPKPRKDGAKNYVTVGELRASLEEAA